MLNHRRQERENKRASDDAAKSRASGPATCPINHLFNPAKKNDNDMFPEHIADDRLGTISPTNTTNLLPKEITSFEPFDAFPIKIELYMLELLSSCECSHLIPHFLLSLFYIYSTKGLL
jgi:hypothetical protein